MATMISAYRSNLVLSGILHSDILIKPPLSARLCGVNQSLTTLVHNTL